MLTLWGRLNSINVQKVVWCLAEAAIPYQRIDAGREFGVVGTPDYLAKNPNGLVPVIEDDGLTLWESNAIVRYLAEKYATGSLWPTDRATRAAADRAMDWQQTTLNPAISPAFLHLYRLPADKRDDQVIAASLAKTNSVMAMLDQMLAGQAFMAGDAFSMGDIPVACTVHRWLNMDIARDNRPHIARYYSSIMARPAARQTLTLPVS
jgi:glutathione S-transferase